MSTIKQLLISGVRSFGPDEHDSQLIVFKKPLTLILGDNGCGKTTIIESLKFALCGQLPPNSNSGQSFVHDPKMNKSREVLAQIRLQFTSANGTRYLIVKSMQAQRKLKQITFKRVDSTLQIVDDPTKPVEISGRCGETDATLASILGVSKAILDNVIFCHQDESNWPLEGGKKLKERFDAIFDATKYNKCFESIRKLRKQYAIDIKMIEQEVKFLSERKQECDVKKVKINEEEEKIERAKEKLKELEEQIGPVQKRLTEINVIENNIVKIKTEKETTKARLENCLQQQVRLKKNIKNIYIGSEEDLKSEIASFTSNLQLKQKQMDEATRKLTNLKKMEEETSKKISLSEIKKSELFTLEGQNQERMASRNVQLVKAAEFVDIPIPSDIDDEKEATKLFDQVTRKGKAFSRDLKELQVTCDAEEKDLQSTIDSCRDATARHKQKILNKRQECNELNRKLEKLKSEIALANESKGKLQAVEENSAEADRKLEEVSKECDVETLQDTINSDGSKVEALEKLLEELGDMIAKMQTQRSKQTEINIQKEALATKQKMATRYKNKNRDTMVELLGNKIPEKNFKSVFQNCKFELKNEANELNKNLKTRQHEVTSLDSKRIHQKEELTKKRSELTSAEEELYNHCGKLSLEDKLGKLDADIEVLQDQKIEVSSFKFVTRKFVEKLKEERPCCPLCHRGFDNQQEISELISELDDKVRSIPKSLDSVDNNLSRQISLRDQLVSMKPLDKRIKKLKNEEIPSLEKTLDKTEKDLQEARDAVDELSMSVSEPERKLNAIETMLPDMSLLDQTVQEINSITQEIVKLESELGGQQFEMDVDEAVSKQSSKRKEIAQLRDVIKSNQGKLNRHNQKLQNARDRKNQLKEEFLRIQAKIQELVSLQAQMTATEKDKEKGEIDLKILVESLKCLEDQLKSSEEKRKNTIAKNRVEIQKHQEKVQEFNKLNNIISGYNKEIEEHKSKNVMEQLNNMKVSLVELNTKKNNLSTEIQSYYCIVDGIKDDISNQEINKRDLDDNLTLRSHQKEEMKLEEHVKKIETNIGEMNEVTINTEKRKLIGTLNDSVLEQAKTNGEIKKLTEYVKDAKKELQQSQYKDVHLKHKRKFCELILLKASEKDLKDYSFSMDVCLMKFHKEKMTKINTIIRDMWRSIYRGNDIDYIEIKTDENETNTSGNKRMYDYRVVQRRNDTEIDMSGRCSAGQKVLASLIIRMALAETFSNRFGILALDEPTTNLDKENVTSLCNALGDMVLNRMSQNNFMFIIITHDTEFLKSLGRIDKLTHYYEVTRNQDGKSRIKKLPMV